MSIINTKTKVTLTGSNVDIYTWYQKCLGYLNFWIHGLPQNINGVNFEEGQLGYTIEGSNDIFFLNSDGDLIVQSDNVDKYSINSNGDLLTNVDFCGNLIPDTENILRLTFDSILNTPVLNPNSVSDWNEFFDLPVNGNPFSSVAVDQNVVSLVNEGTFSLDTPGWIFTNLVKIEDSGSVTSIIGNSLMGSPILTDAVFPKVTEILSTPFYWCYAIQNIYIPVCTNLGGTVGYDTGFQDTGSGITITIPSYLMTCNGGQPDGDIQYLIDYRVGLTIIQV